MALCAPSSPILLCINQQTLATFNPSFPSLSSYRILIKCNMGSWVVECFINLLIGCNNALKCGLMLPRPQQGLHSDQPSYPKHAAWSSGVSDNQVNWKYETSWPLEILRLKLNTSYQLWMRLIVGWHRGQALASMCSSFWSMNFLVDCSTSAICLLAMREWVGETPMKRLSKDYQEDRVDKKR